MFSSLFSSFSLVIRTNLARFCRARLLSCTTCGQPPNATRYTSCAVIVELSCTVPPRTLAAACAVLVMLTVAVRCGVAQYRADLPVFVMSCWAMRSKSRACCVPPPVVVCGAMKPMHVTMMCKGRRINTRSRDTYRWLTPTLSNMICSQWKVHLPLIMCVGYAVQSDHGDGTEIWSFELGVIRPLFQIFPDGDVTGEKALWSSAREHVGLLIQLSNMYPKTYT